MVNRAVANGARRSVWSLACESRGLVMQSAADVLQAFLSMKGISLPDVPVSVKNDDGDRFENCERHGQYRVSMRDDRGVVRYRPSVCPVCLAER
jgi:hypothetical protein